MGDTDAGCGDNINRSHHPFGKFIENCSLQAGYSVETRMIGGSCGQIDAGAPSLMQRVRSRADHTRQHLDTFQLPHRGGGKHGLDSRAQAFFIDRPDESTREPYRRLLEGHDLEAMAIAAGGRKTGLPHREATMNDKSGSTRGCHRHSPLPDYFLLRWVSAEAAALFAALLLLGSRRTFDAALAAFLLVTSRFGLRLGIAVPHEFYARHH
ncbi:hypothetical protein [Rhizobium ruizarguesonis]|uniref:hypothetical protein n=1 Tax=Rhizobium ruizarguesonis TaxID=2081791 RepID=UPI0029623011|nr:hypothetical protein [Rhizobium ruizarguesonis]